MAAAAVLPEPRAFALLASDAEEDLCPIGAALLLHKTRRVISPEGEIRMIHIEAACAFASSTSHMEIVRGLEAGLCLFSKKRP